MSDTTNPSFQRVETFGEWKPQFQCDLRTITPQAFEQLVKRFREWAKQQPRTELGLKDGWNMITPQTAEQLLIRNVRNRKMRLPEVLRYATAMANNRWKKTGETVIITDRGDLEDAGHRAMACYLSGCSFITYVVTNVPHDDNLFAYIDNGISRTGEDTLVAGGVNGLSKLLQTVIKTYAIPYDDGNLVFQGRPKMSPINNVEILDYARHHPDLSAVARQIQDGFPDAVKRLDTKPGTVFVAWKITQAYGQHVMEDFLVMLNETDLPAGHPIAALQKRLDQHEAAKEAAPRSAKAKQKLNDAAIVGLTMRAFNFWQKNQTVARIDPRMDDPFPKIEAPAPAEDEDAAAA